MKNKELIEILQKLDPEAEVYYKTTKGKHCEVTIYEMKDVSKRTLWLSKGNNFQAIVFEANLSSETPLPSQPQPYWGKSQS